LKILPSDSPILRSKCAPFDFAQPPFDPIEYAKELAKFMRDSGGIGLSANQVEGGRGELAEPLRYRIFVMRADPNIVCVNPRIVSAGTDKIQLEEGCLSFPGLIVKIKRPKVVRVRFQQPNGETVTEQYIGMAARIFQHELDHLDGVLFYSRANKFHRDQAFRQWEHRKRHKIGVHLELSTPQQPAVV